MVKITKVYTKTGDRGETGLVGGRRIPKDHARIESYGTTDELNSILGIVRSFNAEAAPTHEREILEQILETIQQKLFDLGSELATLPEDEYEGMVKVTAQDVEWLEEVIDHMNDALPSLRSFILPGGSPMNAFIHQARTVCRRAERELIHLMRGESVGEWVLPYLNRLSDALFVIGRWCTATMEDEKENLWVVGKAATKIHW